ncbi:hypothetical protein [Chitinophaga caeni]|nr:hypothetical protein [Chitinophaga caeni]
MGESIALIFEADPASKEEVQDFAKLGKEVAATLSDPNEMNENLMRTGHRWLCAGTH